MQQTPNILFLSSWYPNKYRPLLGIFVKRQAEAVAKLCNVSVIYISSGEKSELVETTENGVYTIKGYFKKVHNHIPLISHYQRTSRYFAAWRKALTLYKNTKGKPDLIHSNIVYPVSIITRNLSKKWNVPYVISEHWSGYFPQDGRYHGFMRSLITTRAVQGASAIITVSEALKVSMLNIGLANTYFVISNIVDTSTFNIPETSISKEDFTFIHVSSLVEMEKNVSGIIRAFNNINKQFPESKLLIVGDGDNKPALEKLVQERNVGNAVHFAGEKRNEEVARLMQDSDAFILFSNFETQGVALLEALCCGIPGIATTTGGPADYINEVNGILIEPGNERQLEDAMIKMIENRNSYKPLIVRNSVVQMVNEKIVAQKIMDVYNSVLTK